MVKIAPASLYINHSANSAVNGRIVSGHDIGANFPKGFYLHLFGPEFYISKDGLALMTKKYYGDAFRIGLCMAIPLRFFALLEAILYLISIPFQLIGYAIVMFLGVFFGLFFLPTLFWDFQLCCRGKFLGKQATNRNICLIAWMFFWLSILALFYIAAYTVLLPIQILFPEFCVYVLRFHKWNTTQFEYF